MIRSLSFALIYTLLFPVFALGQPESPKQAADDLEKQYGDSEGEQKETKRKKDEAAELHQEVQKAKKKWQSKDPSFKATLDKAYAYAIFPEVGKGGFVVGGAHGTGEVYEKGRLIGHAKLTQTTIGAQVGGQTFVEVILFQNDKALQRFKESRFEGAAQATAIGGKKGAAAAAKYKDGVAVMVLPLKGAMAEAAAGGQKFKFEPLKE